MKTRLENIVDAASAVEQTARWVKHQEEQVEKAKRTLVSCKASLAEGKHRLSQAEEAQAEAIRVLDKAIASKE